MSDKPVYKGRDHTLSLTQKAKDYLERKCTCHPDDCPPKPCPQKYALSGLLGRNTMFKYLKNRLGNADIRKALYQLPDFGPFIASLNQINAPEGDDTLIMHQLRSMGYFGGWAVRKEYLKGYRHGVSNLRCRNCGCNTISEESADA